MNTNNHFYIRYLQQNYYGYKNPFVQALFSLEHHFFNCFRNVEESLMVQIKLKWLEEEIKKENSENPIIKHLIPFLDKKLKKELLLLIKYFSEIIGVFDEKTLVEKVKKFNWKFNLILSDQNLNDEKKFGTSYFFQTIFFLYSCNLISKFNISFFENLFKLMDKTEFDIFELVFLEIFFKKKNVEEKKIKKLEYLFRLLLKFFGTFFYLSDKYFFVFNNEFE